MRRLTLSALAYATVTFPLAYIWHLVAFADVYDRVRFTTVAEPNIPLGFFTILFQGILLAVAYGWMRRSGRPLADGVRFGLLVGAFIWSAAAVAHAAKHDVVYPAMFIGMEGLYFLVNFLSYGLLMGLIHREEEHGG